MESQELRPSASNPSPQFKNELRQALLEQYEGSGLSRLEMIRLWRFASTVIGVFVLIGVIIYFWATISNPTAPVTLPQDTLTVSPQPVQNQSEEHQPQTDSLELISVSPPFGTPISGTTSFSVTVHYTLSSVPTADIIIFMFPTDAGPADMGNAQQSVTQGSGEITLTFDFKPVDPTVASEWTMPISMFDASLDFQTQMQTSPLANISLNEEATWHYTP